MAALLLGVSAGAVPAEMAAPTAPPVAPECEAQTVPVDVNRSDMFEFRALTVKLIEGAKWSDGDPFDTQDIAFYRNDVILDENDTPLMGASPEICNSAAHATVGPFIFTLTFADPFPEQVLYPMAYGNFCPGASHLRKPEHPKHGGESYEAFLNAFPSDFMNFPAMGASVVVEHRPDDIVVKRRNPCSWTVYETGQQLPYLVELLFRLSSWGDRGPKASPARHAVGPRSIGCRLFFERSANGWGEPDVRTQEVRGLSRNLDFRKAVSRGFDRQRLTDTDGNGMVNVAGEMDLQPDEEQLVEAMMTWQKVITGKVTTAGLTAYPGALISNKRFAKIPAGAPIFTDDWAEDDITRERVFLPADSQIGAELHPQTLPGAPGLAGPMAAEDRRPRTPQLPPPMAGDPRCCAFLASASCNRCRS
jgi:hypothetical protein